MNTDLAWTLAGLALCGAELLHPGVFLLWIGLAAVATGAATWAFGLQAVLQIGTFIGSLAVLLCVPLLDRRRHRGFDGGVNAADIGLVGATCRAIAFVGSEGRVTFRDGAWPAQAVDDGSPAPGTNLRIVGRKGTVLLVEPLPERS